ncbi:MAG: EAL domain-containing protein [Eubacteriales bacterium]|nr:EAL domain-containing protein [Eubacteriales bacterium]
MGEKFQETLFKISEKFEETNAFIAIRQGLIMMIPLIVLGSFSLTVKSLPIPAYQQVLPEIFGGKLVEFLDFIYAGTFEIFSVALAITTSVCYAMVKNTKVHSERAVVNDCFILAILTLISLMGYMGIQNADFTKVSLGTTNTFMSLLVALGSGWFYFEVKEWKIFSFLKRSETEVDGMYYIAVHSIIPATVVVSIFAIGNQVFTHIFHVDNIQQGLVYLMENVLSLFKGGFSAGLAILISIHVMWFFGLHGSNVLDGLIKKNYTMIDSIEIYNKTFQDVFVIMGGCGAVLGLLIAILLFSRKKIMKNVAKLALPGVLFNISEVIIFGLPIIFNPVFFFPFLMVPVVNYLISYGAIYLGLVPRVISQVEWTAPVLLSGYQATGSLAGSALQLFCLALDVVMYVPFIRLFEIQRDNAMRKKVNMLVEFLQHEEERSQITSLTGRDDVLGNIARMIANDLKEAVRKKELYIMYQPQVDTEEHCIGAEALLRWKHPIVGFVYPPLIIRLAKELDILKEMEQYIFDTAASALASIEKETDQPFKISVNITNESLMWDGFEKMVDDCVKKHHIFRERLWMEITEQDALATSMDITDKINNLKAKGHKFLIDDFGMGHTSLLYLQTNNFEVVKIDGTITRELMENERYRDILKSIIYLGNLLHFMTIAEFVETK